MRSSSSRRWVLRASRCWARRRASTWSLLRNSWRAVSAAPMRPAALMRGARRKTTCPALRRAAASEPLTVLRAAMPGRAASASLSSPPRTRMRFCPPRRMTSASVPRATRSSTLSILKRRPVCGARAALTAAMRKKATPTPARWGQGMSSSGPRRGLQMASAGGSSGGGRWWSEMTTVMPSSRARATAAMSEMPQSTVSRMPQPCAASSSMAGMFRP